MWVVVQTSLFIIEDRSFSNDIQANVPSQGVKAKARECCWQKDG